MQLDSGRRKVRPLSLTSLIDVIFLLLVFFMLSSTFLKYTSYKIDAGRGGKTSTPVSDVMLLRIHEDGRVDLNGQPVEVGNLLKEIAKFNAAISPEKKQAKTKVAVKPMGEASVQHLVQVLESLSKNKNIALMIVK